MPDLHFVLIALGLVLVFGSFIAAEQGSGYMPFSGYKEERFWSKVSLGLQFLGFLCIISIAFF